MKIGYVALLTLSLSSMSLADFSYTKTFRGYQRVQIEKHCFKGQKMMVESAGGSTILDFDAHTLTRTNNALKLYSVTKFSDLPVPPKQTEVDVTVYVQETGRTKSVGGYEAREVVLTADMDSPQIRQRPIKAQTEIRLWLSTGVPGAEVRRAFYERNREHFPWSAMAGGGMQPAANAMAEAVQESFAEAERKKTELKGVPVLEIHTFRAAAGGLRGPNTQDWAQARAQLEEQRQKGGPGADKAAQSLARADSMGGDPFALTQSTSEFSGFSTEPIPDSVFTIPPEYKLVTEAELSRGMMEGVRAQQAPAKGSPAGNAGVIGGIIGSVPTVAPAPPPSGAAGQPDTPQRIRVGGNVEQARLIRQDRPVYPPLAKQARISGHVLLDVIINKDGTIQDLKLVSGHPLLAPAAMEAVKNWIYQPTLLNGSPAEVVTQIDVNFTLSDNPRPLQSGQVGQDYHQVLPVDGQAPSGAKTWALVSGSLPSGLSLDAGGAVSGKPSAAGDFTFGVHVANGDSEASLSFSIHIDPAR